MRLSVLRKPYALLMISLILLLVASMRAFESLYLAEARIPAIFRLIFFLSSRNSGIRHRCAQDIHLRRSSPTLSYPAFNASRRFGFSFFRTSDMCVFTYFNSSCMNDRLICLFMNLLYHFFHDFSSPPFCEVLP